MNARLRELARTVFRSSVVEAHTGYAFRAAASNLVHEFKLDRRHHASLKKAKRFANEGSLKLHVGCGSVIKPGWVNIDLHSDKADLQLDVTESFPSQVNRYQ